MKEQIIALTKEYAKEKFSSEPFRPGKTNIPISGKVFDYHEVCNLVESALDFHLTTYRFNASFEKKLREFIGIKYALTCNSGSSANLLALSAMTSPLMKEKQILPGSEVITVAAGFPTTVNPILQNGLIPVFLDITLPNYNIDISMLEKALSSKTRAIMLAHTLGNPFDLDAVMEFANKHNLWVVEDCCDSLGGTYGGKKLGTFGHASTLSFYPAHHITMGEGGAVLTDDPMLKKAIESIRDWGRDCWCAPGCDNTCHKRFDMQFGRLPQGYDHKYVYSHLGYNLKITDMQAAVADAQIEKLPEFVEIRRRNYKYANIWGLRNLLEFYKNLPIEGFLFFSTSEIYRNPDPKMIPTSEDYRGNVACIGSRACYDESKRVGEIICYLFAEKYNMPITLVRPFNNYDPWMKLNDKRVPADFAKAILENRDIIMFSDGTPTRTFCYISDAVTGDLKALLY